MIMNSAVSLLTHNNLADNDLVQIEVKWTSPIVDIKHLAALDQRAVAKGGFTREAMTAGQIAAECRTTKATTSYTAAVYGQPAGYMIIDAVPEQGNSEKVCVIRHLVADPFCHDPQAVRQALLEHIIKKSYMKIIAIDMDAYTMDSKTLGFAQDAAEAVGKKIITKHWARIRNVMMYAEKFALLQFPQSSGAAADAAEQWRITIIGEMSQRIAVALPDNNSIDAFMSGATEYLKAKLTKSLDKLDVNMVVVGLRTYANK